MVRSKSFQIFFILVFILSAIVLPQGKPGKVNESVQLREESLAVYKSGGEQGLRDYVKKNKGKITDKFIVETVKWGKHNWKEEWLSICKIMAEEKKDEKTLADVLYHTGQYFFYKSNLKKSANYLAKALPIYLKLNDLIGQGNVYKCEGDIYIRTGNNTRAIEMYEKALPFFKKAGDPIGQGNVAMRRGAIYLRTGDKPGAIEMYDKAFFFYGNAGKPLGQANVYVNKGDIYFYAGKNSRAIEMYDKALSIYEKFGHHSGTGNIYFRKGVIYSGNGDNSRALGLFEKAVTVYKKTGSPIEMGEVYTGKAGIYFQLGDNPRAIEMFDHALGLFEKAGDPVHLGQIYRHKAYFYHQTGENSKAFQLLDKALHLFEKVGNPTGQGNVYQNKGEIYLETGDHSRAFEMLDEALSFYKKAKVPIGMGGVYQNKGYLYFRRGENSKAIKMFDKALLIYKKVENIERLSHALHAKAKVLVKLEKKNEALHLFENAVGYLETLRIKSAFSEMKRSFMEKVYDHYQEIVLFMLENNYDHRGFKYAEAMTSRVFLDQMAEGLVRLDKGLNPGLKEKRDDMVAKLSRLSKEMHETSKEKKFLELKDRYHKVESKLEDLLIKIRLDNPLYASVRYPRPISVRALQKEVLKKNEMLIRYFISPGKTYAFLVSRGTFKVIAFDIKEKEINNTVGVYLRALKEKNAAHIKRYGINLYRELFKPLEPSINKSKEIIIIPDGQLATIPFESLIIHKKKSGRPVFLLEKYRIKYIQSASLLSILRKHYRGNSETKNFIGFGDPVYDYESFKKSRPAPGQAALTSPRQPEDEIKQALRSRYARSGGKLDRLPASGEEVRAIARLFKKHSRNAMVFSRDQATETNAKAPAMKDYDYIHFACHGLLNDDFQSLVLSRLPQDQSTEDGYFTLNEIMNCDYRAKLIVLSACRTGSGKMERAEGVTGLTRAVMYAGTPAVVASLWNVDDQAAKELMLRFYRSLLEKNMDKAEALRQAKLELLKNKKYRSPLFWSAFVMYGE